MLLDDDLDLQQLQIRGVYVEIVGIAAEGFVGGCDVFTFRSGTIAVKNSFRKNRLPAT